MDVALHGGHHDDALGARLGVLLRFDERGQVGHCLLHHPGALDHLRQKHLAGAEQVADPVHAVHQRAFDDLDGLGGSEPGLFGVLDDVLGDAVDQGVPKPLLDGQRPPFGLFHGGGLGAPAVALGDLQQTLGGVRAAVQHQVLNPLAQFSREVGVDAELAGVDDAHGQARLDGVVEEYAVDGFAHWIVAAEGEGDVADPSRGLRTGQVGANPAAGFDEVHGVVAVFVDPRADGEDVGIEDDVLWIEARLLDKDSVTAGADLDLALQTVGLAGFVERHDDHSRPVGLAAAGRVEEGLLALLEADGVDDGFALHAFQPRLDDLPAARIDHHRHPGDVRLGGDPVEETDHGGLGVEHALVHVDVDHLGAGFDLLAGHLDGGFKVVVANQAGEAGGAGDVGALADVDEQRVLIDDQRLESGRLEPRPCRWNGPRRCGCDGVADGRDVIRRGATAAAN